jgi:endonuclease/exonuclease/phosphatase family metal-dependent hydrolase
VFSRYDFTSWHVIEHSHHPVDWEAPAHPLAAKEPRRGRRTTLAADVAAPGGAVRVYCTHLEVFCGILGRAWQFSDIFRDVKGAAAAGAAGGAAGPEEARAVGRRRQQQQLQQQLRQQPVVQRFAILGDLNTVCGQQ